MALIFGGVNCAASVAMAMATALLNAQEVLAATGPEHGLMPTGGAVGRIAGGLRRHGSTDVSDWTGWSTQHCRPGD